MRNLCSIVIAVSLPTAQVAAAVVCDADETRIPISFRFQNDPIAQSSWVLKSLQPKIILEKHYIYPETSTIRDGVLALDFCAKNKDIKNQFTFTVGPRSMILASRPPIKLPNGENQMAAIELMNQPKPDWIIVKSIERLSRGEGTLPSFDVELFNFGSLHPGGRVIYRAGNHTYACMSNARGQVVTVQVALSGKRLKVASSDPEFPEELVERSAQVKSGYCGGNFDVSADFGSTGRLAPGPTRIRYAIKSTDVPSKSRKMGFAAMEVALPDLGAAQTYFPLRGYHIAVEGDGIWSE